jgi:hypothetical protein
MFRKNKPLPRCTGQTLAARETFPLKVKGRVAGQATGLASSRGQTDFEYSLAWIIPLPSPIKQIPIGDTIAFKERVHCKYSNSPAFAYLTFTKEKQSQVEDTILGRTR